MDHSLFPDAIQLYPSTDDVARQIFKKVSDHYDNKPHKERYGGKTSLTFFDPSAGTGTLLDYACKSFYPHAHRYNCFACEIDTQLRYTLTGKGYQWIDGDFLATSAQDLFDVVVMNPPFRNGAEHVLKAWQFVKPGGILVAILNADNFENPTGKVKELEQLLDHFNGTREDIGQPFRDGVRKTDVNVTLISIARPKRESTDFSSVNFEFSTEDANEYIESGITSSSQVSALVAQYNATIRAIKQRDLLQQEINGLLTGIHDPIRDKSAQNRHKRDFGLYSGTIDEDQCLKQHAPLHAQLKATRSKFWATVFSKLDIGKDATSKFKQDFIEFQVKQSSVEFSEKNILDMLMLFVTTKEQVMMQALGDCFDMLTKFHEDNTATTEGGGPNYTGWKHNKSWKVNGTKVIIPSVTRYEKESYGGYKWTNWKLDNGGEKVRFMEDLDKVCKWLRPRTDTEDFQSLCNTVNEYVKKPGLHVMHTWVESHFFEIRLYKTGTMHLRFKDRRLLDDFNFKASKFFGERLGQGT